MEAIPRKNKKSINAENIKKMYKTMELFYK